MFISHPIKSKTRGFTLVEMLIALGLSTVIIAGVISGFIFCTKGMMAFSNYDKMNQADQLAIDKITREIRGMGGMTNYSTAAFTNAAYPTCSTITNSATFFPVNSTSSNNWVTYSYNSAAQALVRSQGGSNQTYLSNCCYLNFSLFQRNQSNGTFMPIPTTNAALVKLVQVAWNCSQAGSVGPSQSESVKSTEVVIRCK